MALNKELCGEKCKIGTLVYFLKAHGAGGQEYCFSHSAWVNTCVNCGHKFHTTRNHAKTCSNKCRQSLTRMKV